MSRKPASSTGKRQAAKPRAPAPRAAGQPSPFSRADELDQELAAAGIAADTASLAAFFALRRRTQSALDPMPLILEFFDLHGPKHSDYSSSLVDLAFELWNANAWSPSAAPPPKPGTANAPTDRETTPAPANAIIAALGHAGFLKGEIAMTQSFLAVGTTDPQALFPTACTGLEQDDHALDDFIQRMRSARPTIAQLRAGLDVLAGIEERNHGRAALVTNIVARRLDEFIASLPAPLREEIDRFIHAQGGLVPMPRRKP